MNEVTVLRKQRVLIHRVVSELSREDCLAIPSIRSNNIAWNLGHIITVQQALTRGLSKQPLRVPMEYMQWYFRDTSPANWTEEPDISKLLDELMALPETVEQDMADGVFAGFAPYTTVTGIALDTIEDAMGFNNFHEGAHFGIILAIKKELAAGV